MNRETLEIVLGVLGKYELNRTIAYALRFLLRNSYESFIIVDAESKVQFMDKGSEKVFGLSQGAAKGADIRDFVPQSGLPLAIKTGKPIIGRIFEVKDTKRIGSVYPIIRDGEILGALGRIIFPSLEELEKTNIELSRLKKEINYFREKEHNEYSAKYTFENILGDSPAIKETIDFAKKISGVDTDVLIMGESGTGKELFAQSMHSFTRWKSPFVKVNCPTIPFDLAESELFGYAKGAFSGALTSGKQGKFEIANNGSIFLDEISSLPLSIQSKLLRVLQEREIERLGSTKTEKINVKVIAATNIDLRTLVKEGKFREDLYYRISKAIIRIPPLRERKSDISVYAEHYLEKLCRSFKIPPKRIAASALEMLKRYNWPGNVRELINTLEQAVLKSWDSEVIATEHFSSDLSPLEHELFATEPQTPSQKKAEGFQAQVEEKEKQLIISALRSAKGSKKKALALLGMPRSTFYKRLKEYGIIEHG